VFVKVRQAFTVGAILFLLMLFLLPSLYLKRECEALNQLCDRVVSSRDRAAYDQLRERYEAMRGKAELFLDHKVVDQATVPLELMGVYLDAGDAVALKAAAAEFRQALRCMLSIETGNIRLLL
jgi:hypothetical protein